VNDVAWHVVEFALSYDYFFNVCADTEQVPPACEAAVDADKAPAFQTYDKGDDKMCFELGKLSTMHWEEIGAACIHTYSTTLRA